MTIICQVCGTANPDGTTYCEGCGVELSGNAPSTTSTANAHAASTPTPAAAAPLTPPGTSNPVEIPPLEPVATSSTSSAATPASGDLTHTIEPVMPAQAHLDAPAVDTPAPATSPTSATPEAQAQASAEPVYALDAASMPTPAATAAAEPVAVEPITSDPVLSTPAPSSPVASNPVASNPVASNPVPTNPVTAPTTPTSTGEAKLGVKKFGVVTGDFIPLQGERLVVGRFDASTGPVDIDLSGLTGQEHISRRHAELYCENGVWHVRDLGSTNGVYVKHQGESAFSPRLQEPAALADGDEIAFGNLMMTFNQG